MEKEAEIINKYMALKKDAEACGITLKTDIDSFVFADIPKGQDVISFKSIEEVDAFVFGYSLAYKANL